MSELGEFANKNFNITDSALSQLGMRKNPAGTPGGNALYNPQSMVIVSGSRAAVQLNKVLSTVPRRPVVLSISLRHIVDRNPLR